MNTKGVAEGSLRALPSRFLPPIGHVLDRNGTFGIKGTVTAAWATYRELVGQYAELLDRNVRPAFPARNHAALVAGLSQKLDALCRH